MECIIVKYFCVFGNPISHSLSPLIHNATLCSLGLPHLYARYHLLDSSKLKSTFFKLNLSGANITLPFKEEAFKQADEIRGIAKGIGAVNTFVLENNKIIGYNTDAPGFYATIKVYSFKSALILGAGGSAKAIAYILKQNNFDVVIANRSNKNASIFETKNIPFFLFSRIPQKPYDIIINATSSSIQNTLPLDENTLGKLFSETKMVYDLIYGIKSAFLESAKRQNLTTKDGRDMLIWQAVYALKLFCPEIKDENLVFKIMDSVMR